MTELTHHGILGMKWGIRRSPEQLKRRSSGGPTSSQASKPKTISEMSDDELRAKLNRLDMEKRYKQAMAELNPQKESAVKKLMSDLLASGAKTLGQGAFNALSKRMFEQTTTKAEANSDLKGSTDWSKLNDKQIQDLKNRMANIAVIEKFLDPYRKK